jgi:DNA polymerase-3 subunit gamma/tau
MEISNQLEKIAKAENINVDKQVLFTIAKGSDGSMRDAESILDQLFSFSRDKISIKDVVSVLGLVEQETLFAITDKILQKDAKGALNHLNNIIDAGKDSSVFLSNMIEHFRNLMVAKVAKADEKLIDLPSDVCERLLRQSEGFSLEELIIAFNVLVNAQEMAKRLESLRIPLEISLIRLAHDKRGPASVSLPQKKSTEPEQPTQKAESLKERITEEKAKDDDCPVSAPQAISLDEIKSAWGNIIENLGKVKMSVATYLNEGEPIKAKGEVLTIAFPKSCSLHKESLERKDVLALIEKTFLEILRVPLKAHFILSDEVKREAQEGHAFIKSALDMFNGRVIREG